MSSRPDEASILAIDRPDPKLWTYYILCCLAVLPLAPLLLPIHWFRYHTMRYRFTDEGVSMSWGILFRREILLNYARIQDIHLHSNLVERWLGLARLQIQTASGSASAEMTLEGLTQFEAVRDFLYSRMRGVKEAGALVPAADHESSGPVGEDLAAILREIAHELRELRAALPSESTAKERPPHV
ncbi:MAG: PH domain-containing protein [Verrucomicrobiota bacterium]